MGSTNQDWVYLSPTEFDVRKIADADAYGLIKSQRVEEELRKPVISLKNLRKLAMDGLPENGGLRSKAWKVLLGYLPPETAAWPAELATKRAQYRDFCKELFVNPRDLMGNAISRDPFSSDPRRSDAIPGAAPSARPDAGNGSANDDGGSGGDGSGATPLGFTILAGGPSGGGKRSSVELEDGDLRRESMAIGDGSGGNPLDDHPLNVGATSKWNSYFRDNEELEQIDRDVKRTHPDMHFFNQGDECAHENQEALKRALFVFAKLNPGIRYVQGMNEVLAPLFYVFKNDPDKDFSDNAEPDAFFCFVQLLGEFRDHFCKQLDNSEVGIHSTMARLMEMLRQQDPQLHHHLTNVAKVNPQFYAFRWLTLLLTQEFSFPDLLRLWDSLLSDSVGIMPMLLNTCCSMLLYVRETLLVGDFVDNLKLLQKYPPCDVKEIVRVAQSFGTQAR
eukprot:jgi/Mesvir1/20932/Mv08003-RA.1